MTSESEDTDREQGGKEDWDARQRKLELAKQTYTEVLDATKHQDDKVGRYLAALAFLTTGAIALLFRGGILSRQFEFSGNYPFEPKPPLIAIAALGFFACVLLSVALLLLCLSTPLRVPGQRRDASKKGSSLSGSRLFFSYIGAEPISEWRARWDAPAEAIQAEMTSQYFTEAHNLAERARSKYQHTNEAAALFVFSLVFLALAVSLTVYASLQPSDVVPVGRGVTLIVGLVSAFYSWAVLHSQVVHEKQSMQDFVDGINRVDQKAISRKEATGSLAWMSALLPIALVLVAAIEDDRGIRTLAAVFFIFALGWAFSLTQSRWTTKCPSCRRRTLGLALMGISAIVVGFALGGPFQLALLLVYPTFLFMSTLRESSRRHRISQYRLVGAAPGAHSAACLVYSQRVERPDAAPETVGTP
ncbi:hypothetical protein [Nocardioides astragali]|uniref:Pycsar effector protein domain-containing protein n=1 Tax=Nocardioides astragali TaxID=1776736 RepID=A0ABW2MVB5_9ACTN|nr:hypothetical protein [Nocardioides astragali]